MIRDEAIADRAGGRRVGEGAVNRWDGPRTTFRCLPGASTTGVVRAGDWGGPPVALGWRPGDDRCDRRDRSSPAGPNSTVGMPRAVRRRDGFRAAVSEREIDAAVDTALADPASV